MKSVYLKEKRIRLYGNYSAIVPDPGASDVHGIYYGASTDPGSYDADFIETLNKHSNTNFPISFSVNVPDDNYVFVFAPADEGEHIWFVNGFVEPPVELGTVEFTDPNGFTRTYRGSRTEFHSLATIFIEIKNI